MRGNALDQPPHEVVLTLQAPSTREGRSEVKFKIYAQFKIKPCLKKLQGH